MSTEKTQKNGTGVASVTDLEPAPGWLGIVAREQPEDSAWWIAYGFEPWSVGSAPFCLPRPVDRQAGHGRRSRIALMLGQIGTNIGRAIGAKPHVHPRLTGT